MVRKALGATLVVSVVAVAALAVTPGCAGNAHPPRAALPAGAREIKVSLFDIDCAECADKVVSALRKDGTVYASTFDKRRVVLDLRVAPSIGTDQVVAAAKRAGFRGEIGDAGGRYRDEPVAPSGADIETPVTDGHDIASLATLVVPGKVTLIDFFAEWCGRCRDVDTHVKGTVLARGDVAYRRLNVVDWDSPLAMHYMTGVPHLPYVVVFDRKGQQVDAIAGLDLARLDAAIARAAR